MTMMSRMGRSVGMMGIIRRKPLESIRRRSEVGRIRTGIMPIGTGVRCSSTGMAMGVMAMSTVMIRRMAMGIVIRGRGILPMTPAGAGTRSARLSPV